MRGERRPAANGSSSRFSPPSHLSFFSLRVSLSPGLLRMEAAQKMVKQRSMEALDKLRTYTNVEENTRRPSTYNLGGGAGAKEPALTSYNIYNLQFCNILNAVM